MQRNDPELKTLGLPEVMRESTISEQKFNNEFLDELLDESYQKFTSLWSETEKITEDTLLKIKEAKNSEKVSENITEIP